LFEHLRIAEINWAGRMGEAQFLERVFTISKMRSTDNRQPDMYGDVALHRDHFCDWGDQNWVYDDDRLDLMNCSDEKLLRFLAEMLHPLVRPNKAEVDGLLATFNEFLARDGYQLEVDTVISGKRTFIAVSSMALLAGGTDEAKQVADEMVSDHVTRQVARMKDAVRTDPALAIGSAKEFVESVAKGILGEQNVPVTGNETMIGLVQMARKELNLTISPAVDDTLKRTLSGLSSVTQGVAELRGKLGTGHGANPDTERPPVEVARLVVGMATTLGVFLWEVHRNRRKRPEPAPKELADLDSDIPF
jgi:hypothetical protein